MAPDSHWAWQKDLQWGRVGNLPQGRVLRENLVGRVGVDRADGASFSFLEGGHGWGWC